MTMRVVLAADEILALDQQDPSTTSDGGVERLLVRLHQRVERARGALDPTDDDRRRIAM
jgi:hypothetical protein